MSRLFWHPDRLRSSPATSSLPITITRSKENDVSTAEVERLLVAGGADKALRIRYDQVDTMENFVALAGSEGYDFTVDELKQVLREAGDSFESQGNPRARQIWWS